MLLFLSLTQSKTVDAKQNIFGVKLKANVLLIAQTYLIIQDWPQAQSINAFVELDFIGQQLILSV